MSKYEKDWFRYFQNSPKKMAGKPTYRDAKGFNELFIISSFCLPLLVVIDGEQWWKRAIDVRFDFSNQHIFVKQVICTYKEIDISWGGQRERERDSKRTVAYIEK